MLDCSMFMYDGYMCMHDGYIGVFLEVWWVYLGMK